MDSKGRRGRCTFCFSSPITFFLLKGYLKNRYRLRERLKKLEEKGWIIISEGKDQLKLELVEEGKKKALYYRLEDLKIEIPDKWDGLWRVVVFDIPEIKKLARDVLRNKLKQLGFFKLQKSVFVFPYPCKKEIEILRTAYEIYPFVTFMIVKEIDKEYKLIEKFDL